MATARTITDRKLQQLAAAVNHRNDCSAASKLRAIRGASPAEIEHAARRFHALHYALRRVDRDGEGDRSGDGA